LGGKPLGLNAIFFRYDFRTVSSAAARWIAAAGCIVNFAASALALGVLRCVPARAGSTRYFLWLFSAVNLLMAFGYLLFSGVFGAGDWSVVINGFGPTWLLRGALILIGWPLYFLIAPKLLGAEARRFFDPAADLKAQTNRLMRLPYCVGGATFVIASLPNPGGFKYLLMSGVAASMGGTSLLLLHRFDRLAAKRTQDDGAPLVLKRSVPWMIAAALTLAVFIGALGPGIRLN
jgi:hypothetical protein